MAQLEGNNSADDVLPTVQDTRIALFLLEQLAVALQANDPDLFKRWLYGAVWRNPGPRRASLDGATAGLA